MNPFKFMQRSAARDNFSFELCLNVNLFRFDFNSRGELNSQRQRRPVLILT